MDVKQLASIINPIQEEILGKKDLSTEDLSNIVDIGAEIQNLGQIDNYVKKLSDRIGKVIFVNRKYSGSAPSVLMDAWEYGSVLEKIHAELPEAIENNTWKLQNGQTYDQNVFNAPKIEAKFYNSKVTFETDLSITERQVKESFNSVSELNGFVSMLQTAVSNSMTVKIDALIMRTINNMIAKTFETINSNRCVNLLSLYNARYGQTLTKDKAISDPAFIRFATFTINTYKDRMNRISVLFNVGGKERFTQGDDLKIVLLSDFYAASKVFVQADTYHNEYTSLPNADTVPYWQGSGQNYAFDSISKIDVQLSSKKSIKQDGILGIMFDRNSLGVCNSDRRTTTNYNAKAEFYNNFFKFDCSYFNDLNENFVVFYAG